MAEMKADKYFYGHEGDVCKKNPDGSYAFLGDADTEVLMELNALQSELDTLKQSVKGAIDEMECFIIESGRIDSIQMLNNILRSHGLIEGDN